MLDFKILIKVFARLIANDYLFNFYIVFMKNSIIKWLRKYKKNKTHIPIFLQNFISFVKKIKYSRKQEKSLQSFEKKPNAPIYLI